MHKTGNINLTYYNISVFPNIDFPVELATDINKIDNNKTVDEWTNYNLFNEAT